MIISNQVICDNRFFIHSYTIVLIAERLINFFKDVDMYRTFTCIRHFEIQTYAIKIVLINN